MQRKRQVHQKRKKDADSRGEIYFGIGGCQRARRHARTDARMHACVHTARACNTMHTLVPGAAQTMAQNHALWRYALWAGKLWHRVRGSCALSFPPYPDSIPPPFGVSVFFHPSVCSDVPASGIEGENSNPDPTGSLAFFLSLSLSLSLSSSLHRQRQIREEIWFVKYNSHARKWARWILESHCFRQLTTLRFILFYV